MKSKAFSWTVFEYPLAVFGTSSKPMTASRSVYCKAKYTRCPKSSFLYFTSLYFSTIGLGKQIISRKVVSINIIHYFHTCCAIF